MISNWKQFLDRKLNEGWRRGVEIDPLKYPDRSDEGLEGPFGTASGKILYYAPKGVDPEGRQGAYYDPGPDHFITADEYQALDHSDAPMHQSPLTDPESPEYRHMQRQKAKGLI